MEDRKLLKEYIRQILKEDGEYLSPGAGEGSPYGVAWGSSEDLVSTFITPFTDVFKTAVGQSKEITRKGRTLLTLSFSALISSFVPFIGSSYKKIFEEERSDLEKIRNEYKEVYERTDKVFSSNEAAFLAFMAAPAPTLGFLAAKESPKVIKNLLSVVTGGLSDNLFDQVKEKAVNAGRWAGKEGRTSSIEDKIHRNDFIRFMDKDKDRYNDDSRYKDTSSETSASVSGKDIGKAAAAVASELIEARIFEKIEKKRGITSKEILANKTFISQAINLSDLASVQKRAIEIYRKTLTRVISEAQKILKNTHTIEDLEKISKKSLPETDKIKNLPPEEKKKAEKTLIDGIRKSMKDFYIKNLSDHVSEVVKSGIPEDSQYVKDYKSAIQKIQTL